MDKLLGKICKGFDRFVESFSPARELANIVNSCPDGKNIRRVFSG